MPILGLHVLVALCFAIHAVRSGQDRYWLFILFAFPLLGSLVYAVAIWLPEARHSRAGRQLVRGVQRRLDPTRELRAPAGARSTPPCSCAMTRCVVRSGCLPIRAR